MSICQWGSTVCQGYISELVSKILRGYSIALEECPFHRTIEGDGVRHYIMRDPDGYFPTCLSFLPKQVIDNLLRVQDTSPREPLRCPKCGRYTWGKREDYEYGVLYYCSECGMLICMFKKWWKW